MGKDIISFRSTDFSIVTHLRSVICDVCRSPDSEEGDEMVFCDWCNICVHQRCYGITSIPAGQWLCRTCALGLRPECVLCPNKSGAMKSTRSGQKWAHLSCVLWIPEVSIGCAEKMEPITRISSIPQSRWALICVLCRERVGACIQCSVKTCKTAYHVTCAFKHGLEMRAIIDEGSTADDDGIVKLRSYCQKHSISSKKKISSAPGTTSDEEVKKKQREDMSTEEKSHARAVKEMNASSERCCSGLKRKSRNESADRKHRSPKKKAICLDKRSLSPVEEIGWQDTLTDLSHYGGPSSDSSSQKKIEKVPEKPPIPEENTNVATRRNIMISVDGDRKLQLEEIIKHLGGVVLAAYESDCEESEKATHLITDDLKKPEEVLCSIASGLWVLHSSYLDDSYKEGNFLSEEDYELGNPKNERFLTTTSLESKSLAQAAHRKRLLIKEGGPSKRPFIGWKVVIISPTIDGIVHSLMRVVKSGGGQILPYKDILKSTHCLFKDNNCVKDVPVPLKLLAKHKIHCVPAVYLIDYLILHPAPNPTLRYIPEYQQFFKSE